MLSRQRRGSTKQHIAANLRLETLELRDVPAAIFATATVPGSAAVVTIKDASTWSTLYTVNPFNGFTGGVTTAIADVNGDGTDDCIVAQGVGGTPSLAEYSGADGSLIRTLSVGDTAGALGASVAAAGKDASGNVLLAVGSVVSGVATVQTINGTDGSVVKSVAPFGSFTGSLSITTADVNADGVADIIIGAGAGGGPRLQVLDGATGSALYDKFMYEDFFVGGVNVSAGTLNGGTTPMIVVGAGVLGGPRVRVLSPATWTTTQDFFAYDSTERRGVQATIFATTPGGAASIVTTDGPQGTGSIAAFDGTTLAAQTAPTLGGIPGNLAVTATAPTLTNVKTGTGGTTPLSLTDDSGMVNTIPDVNATNWITAADGLKTWDTYTGTGAAVTAASTLKVYYTGWTASDGAKFDSARSPSSAASFPLTNLIKGWQEGLIGMRVGGIRRLFIPSALGYGTAGSGSSIPPNADLVFEIKLVGLS